MVARRAHGLGKGEHASPGPTIACHWRRSLTCQASLAVPMIEALLVANRVRRGIWKPQHSEPAAAPPVEPTFHEFASQ